MTWNESIRLNDSIIYLFKFKNQMIHPDDEWNIEKKNKTKEQLIKGLGKYVYV